MADASLVQVLNGREDLSHEIRSLLFVELVHLYDLFEELAAYAELHYDVYVSKVRVSLVETDDVWMINRGQDPQLFLQ